MKTEEEWATEDARTARFEQDAEKRREEINKLNAPLSWKPPKESISDTLEERGKRYGPFKGHAAITQLIKDDMKARGGWARLSDSQKEALEMIAHKIGRILNGDPNYDDSWVDIAGYAQLIVDQLNGKNT